MSDNTTTERWFSRDADGFYTGETTDVPTLMPNGDWERAKLVRVFHDDFPQIYIPIQPRELWKMTKVESDGLIKIDFERVE